MDKQFPTGWVLAVWVLASYLLLGTLSAGGAAPPVLVLLLVLLLWFLVYAFRHRGLGNRKLVRRMHADLEGTLEGLKERMAQQEVHRLATLKHEEQARLEQERRRAEGERRRASTPTRDPAIGKYADMIESRVREHERSGRGSEGP
jgi:predicted Holliday junction resolvase-like endonuclease